MTTSSSRKQRASVREFSFELLEPRNLLAADLASIGFVDVGNGGLVYQLTEPVPVDRQMEVLRLQTGMTDNESFQLQTVSTDQLGFSHFKYQQMAYGIPVENGVYTVHARDGQVESLSGNYIGGDYIAFDAVDPAATLHERLGFKFAIEHALAQIHDGHSHADIHGNEEVLEPIERPHFVWQNAQGQLDFNAIPEGELVFLETGEGELSTAWKFDIYALSPLYRADVYVDANTGEFIKQNDSIHAIDTPANGDTHYNGNASFTADSFGSNPDYRLRANSASGIPSVVTLDMLNGSEFGDAVDVVSPITNFNAAGNVTGVQTHFGADAVADYYSQTFQRNSFDGVGSQLVSYFGYGTNYNNAFWNGQFLTFGDGDGQNFSPLVAIDIIGHEFTHGVVEYTADLIYASESGALNESFADIFGESTEYFATGSASWAIADEVFISGGAIRGMANPNFYDEPDTYLGNFWFIGSGDNGGVHTNGTVQNHWYYLLSEGGTGSNDNGDTYDLTGIGIEDAQQIAYRNLTVYLTPASQYADARVGALQSAIDLFGVNSVQHLSTEAAWDAVGVYGNNLRFQPELVSEAIGSLIYADKAVGGIYYQGYVEEVPLLLDAGQSISLHVVSQDMVPSITVYDSTGNVISDVVGTSGSTFVQSAPVSTGGLYTIEITDEDAGLGSFSAELMLNANFESEQMGEIDNDGFANAENLDSSSIPLGSNGADRLAAFAFLGETTYIHTGDDFESGVFGPEWAMSHTLPNGKIENWGGPGTVSGTQAMFMYQNPNEGFNLNEAILTVDMTGLTGTTLQFYVGSWHDELHFMPFGSYTGSTNGDGVSVSVDGNTWYTMLDRVTTAYAEYDFHSFDLDAFAASKGITLTGDVYFKFQQYDNDPIYSDGIGWDDIHITEQFVGQDWYSFTLDGGETASVVATTVSGDQDLLLELYDSAGNLLLIGNQFESQSAISRFLNNGSTDTYYVRVTGSSLEYSLVVTRGADYDTEPNSLATPQDITDVDGVLGSVFKHKSISAEPDDLGDNTILDNAFEHLTLSNNFGSANIWSADTDDIFIPPTGTIVFAPDFNASDGWNEGLDELRVDFAFLQTKVSIDVGSDDSEDIGWLKAYGANGVLLESITSGGVPFGGSQTITIDRGAPEISYIVAAGYDFHITPLDNLQYTDYTIDDDFYSVTATVGQELEFHGMLPGDGDFDLDNGLDMPVGSMLGMELYDPNGNLISSDNELITHTAALNGDYVLRVYAQEGAGEYYISRSAPGTSQIDVAPLATKLRDGVTSSPLSNLLDTDDVYFQIDPSPTTNPIKQKIDLILVAEVTQSNVSGFGFRLESSMNGGPTGDVSQSISVYNHSTQAWDQIDTRAAANGDSVVDAYVSGSASDYIHSINGEVITQVIWESDSFSGSPFFWNVDVDQAGWLL